MVCRNFDMDQDIGFDSDGAKEGAEGSDTKIRQVQTDINKIFAYVKD